MKFPRNLLYFSNDVILILYVSNFLDAGLLWTSAFELNGPPY